MNIINLCVKERKISAFEAALIKVTLMYYCLYIGGCCPSITPRSLTHSRTSRGASLCLLGENKGFIIQFIDYKKKFIYPGRYYFSEKRICNEQRNCYMHALLPARNGLSKIEYYDHIVVIADTIM